MSMPITEEITRSVSYFFPKDIIKIIQEYSEPEQLSRLSIDSSIPECTVCFEELSSPQIVYTLCCFQKICETCDRIYKHCVSCRTDLGDVRIQFGQLPKYMEHSSKLRLLPGKNTVGSVIFTVKKFFPFLEETQLARPLKMKKLTINGDWCSLYKNEEEITNIGQYFLQNMRLPHYALSDKEVDDWIVDLLTGGCITKNKLTKEEFHKKCSTYAMRIYPSVILQEYINSRLKSLEERGYCKLDKQENTYIYTPWSKIKEYLLRIDMNIEKIFV